MDPPHSTQKVAVWKDTGQRGRSTRTKWLRYWPLCWHLRHCNNTRWTGTHLWRRPQNLPATGTPGKNAALGKEARKGYFILSYKLVQGFLLAYKEFYQEHQGHWLGLFLGEDRCLWARWEAWPPRSASCKWTQPHNRQDHVKACTCCVLASHLSLLLGLGICFPASAHSSPSDGCLNRNKLRRMRHEYVRNWVWNVYNTHPEHTPAIAEEPTCKRAVWSHPLHNTGGQQADHQLNSHQCLC